MMVYKCCIVNCHSNLYRRRKYMGIFFPKEGNLKKRWIRFVNRKDWEPTSSPYTFIKHFEEKHYKKGKNSKRYHLVMNMKPVRLYSIRRKLSIKIQK